MTTFPTYPAIEELAAPHPENLRMWIPRLTAVVNGVRDGKMNSRGELTLIANQASTTVSDARAAYSSFIALFPVTANAAAVVASTYIPTATMNSGSFVIQHPNNANADKTFRYVVLG